MVAKKGPKIEPFGDTLDMGVAMLQAANALDVAAILAETKQDLPALIEIAQTYLAMSHRLTGGGPEEDNDDDEVVEKEADTERTETKFKTGFTAKETR